MSNPRQHRDSHGRFAPDHRLRNRALGAATVVGLGAAAVGAAIRFGLLDRFFPTREGHAAPDLELDRNRPGPEDRAPDAFRPDPDAPVPPAEREALRPPPGVDRGFSEEKRSEELVASVH